MSSPSLLDRLRDWRPRLLLRGGIARGTIGLRQALAQPVPSHVSWSHLLGMIAVFLLCIQVCTGILLAIYYQPSLETARPSLDYITTEVSLGWLVRSMHHYAAEMLLVVIGLHLLRVAVTRAYRSPRGLTWVIGVLLLALCLVFRFTGHALPADQTSYWATVGEAQLLAKLPLLGDTARGLVYGANGVSSQSLSRLYAIHTLVLPWVTLMLLLLHIHLVRRHGFAPPVRGEAGESIAAETSTDAADATEKDAE